MTDRNPHTISWERLSWECDPVYDDCDGPALLLLYQYGSRLYRAFDSVEEAIAEGDSSLEFSPFAVGPFAAHAVVSREAGGGWRERHRW